MQQRNSGAVQDLVMLCGLRMPMIKCRLRLIAGSSSVKQHLRLACLPTSAHCLFLARKCGLSKNGDTLSHMCRSSMLPKR